MSAKGRNPPFIEPVPYSSAEPIATAEIVLMNVGTGERTSSSRQSATGPIAATSFYTSVPAMPYRSPMPQFFVVAQPRARGSFACPDTTPHAAALPYPNRSRRRSYADARPFCVPGCLPMRCCTLMPLPFTVGAATCMGV